MFKQMNGKIFTNSLSKCLHIWTFVRKPVYVKYTDQTVHLPSLVCSLQVEIPMCTQKCMRVQLGAASIGF